MDSKQFEAAVADADTRLSRLRSLYEQWFAGVERVEPLQQREAFDKLMSALGRECPNNTAARFRHQQLVQRYVTYTTYWRRVGRQIEEGTYHRQIVKARRKRELREDDVRSRRESIDIDIDVDLDMDSILHDAEELCEPAPAAAQTTETRGGNAGVSRTFGVPKSDSPPPASRQPQAPPPSPSIGAASPQALPPRGGIGLPVPAPARSLGPAAARPPLAVPSPSATPNRVPQPSPQPPSLGPAAGAARAPQAMASTADRQGASGIPQRVAPASPARPPLRPASNSASPARPAPGTTGGRPTASAKPSNLSDQQIRAIYDRYVAARQKNDERVDNVKLATIEKSVRAMMPKLNEKHAGKRIDFDVVVVGGKVALKPVAK